MYREKEFVERLRTRGLDQEAIHASLETVAEMERFLVRGGASLERPALAAVEAWIADRVRAGAGGQDTVVAAARYFLSCGEEAISIRLLAYLLPMGVLPAMADRLRTLEGDSARDRVMSRVAVPREGSPPEAYPGPTADFVLALEEELGREKARAVLAWNVHGVPAQAFAHERERFLELGSVDLWLADYHGRQVEVLRKHAADGTLWFEQKITRAVVDFVAANPEIQGGVRHGDRIHVTKIPYNPAGYLATSDPLERRRLACHCPLAASTITAAGATVPALWCSCSAGYTRFLFDVVFGEQTEAAVLSSVLGGDGLCRFSIRIPSATMGSR